MLREDLQAAPIAVPQSKTFPVTAPGALGVTQNKPPRCALSLCFSYFQVTASLWQIVGVKRGKIVWEHSISVNFQESWPGIHVFPCTFPTCSNARGWLLAAWVGLLHLLLQDSIPEPSSSNLAPLGHFAVTLLVLFHPAVVLVLQGCGIDRSATWTWQGFPPHPPQHPQRKFSEVCQKKKPESFLSPAILTSK